MKRWKKITYMVAIYMFLVDCQPLEPFLTAYLTGPNGHFSLSEVANEVSAIKSYSSLFASTIMVVTADYFLYKPNLIIVTTCAFISSLLLTGSPSLTLLTVSSAGKGAMYSFRIVGYSYLYAQIKNPKHFPTATGIVSATSQLGKFTGSFSGQIIVSESGVYTLLPYCNLFTCFLAIICVCLFPSVKRKANLPKDNVPNEKSWLLKHDDMQDTTDEHERNLEKPVMEVISFNNLWLTFRSSYSNPTVIKNSLWLIIAMAADIEVLININLLYSYVATKANSNGVMFNGLAETMVTLSGAVGSYFIGKVRIDLFYYEHVFTVICSICIGTLMLSCYFYNQILYIYLSYIVFGFMYQAHLVLMYSGIAKHLKSQCYSFVFELNNIVSMIIVCIMTLFLIQFNFMHITIPGRFLFIGGLLVVLGIIFLFISIFENYKSKIIVYD